MDIPIDKDPYGEGQREPGFDYVLVCLGNPDEKPSYFVNVGNTHIQWTTIPNAARRWKNRVLPMEYKRLIQTNCRQWARGVLIIGRIESWAGPEPISEEVFEIQLPDNKDWKIYYSGLVGEREEKPLTLVRRAKRFYK